MEIAELKLDGNSLGGVMLELFGSDMTAAGSVCGNCGAHGEMARLDVYRGAGIVVRCCNCEAVMIRIVQGRGRTWLDLSGVATLELS
jgi:Family of unknown function (DUF6510)